MKKEDLISKKISLKKNKLEALQLKKKKISAQIQKEEAKIKNTNRKVDTRQKILLGAFVKHLLSEGKSSTLEIEDFYKKFEPFIKRVADKKIFDFANKKIFLDSLY